MYSSFNSIPINFLKYFCISMESILSVQQLLAGLIGLQLVDVLHEAALVLEHVPLHLQVQAVVHVVVSLLRFTVSPEQATQNPHPAHPGHLLRHPGIGCTLSLTYAHVPALPAGQGVFPAPSPGMDRHRFAGDQPIFDQLPDLLTGVGIGDFVGLIGVQPDLPLSYFNRGKLLTSGVRLVPRVATLNVHFLGII
uniref:Uncharacterized protein n=1 Tax=Oryctolagus cuniculus TaxID=9986 RepID=A0A5F9CCT5_RABIT